MPHAHVALAVEGAGWPNPDNIPLMITNTLIGTWDRSVGSGSGMAGQLAVECSRDALCNSFQVDSVIVSHTCSLQYSVMMIEMSCL